MIINLGVNEMEYQIINEIMVIDHNCINKQIMKKIRKYIAPTVK